MFVTAAVAGLAACAASPPAAPAADTKLLTASPAEFCAEAQHIVSHTDKTGDFVVHPDFEGFVKSKTNIDPLTLHVYVWPAPDDPGQAVAISCKMKSADHLNAAFGPGTAAPDGLCQDMNRETLRQVRASLPAVADRQVMLDPNENVFNEKQPAATGPDWLDPRFARFDARVRGVHYCHLIAPGYLRELLTGQAAAGVTIGSKWSPPAAPRQ